MARFLSSKQYHDYGLKAPLAVPMSNNYTDAQLAELGDISLGMIACDYYAYTIDNPVNKEFVAAFEKLYPEGKGVRTLRSMAPGRPS